MYPIHELIRRRCSVGLSADYPIANYRLGSPEKVFNIARSTLVPPRKVFTDPDPRVPEHALN